MGARAKCERGLWYCVEYRDGTRSKKSYGPGAAGQRLAEDAAEEVNLERAMEKRGLIRTATGVRFGDYADEWLRDVITPHKKSGTVRLYGQLLRDHLKPAFGRLTLAELRPQQIKPFIAAKLMETNARGRGQAVTPARRARNTVRNMVALLRTILYHAVDVDELLEVNPAAKFGKRFFEGSGTPSGVHVEIYEPAEIAAILEAARILWPVPDEDDAPGRQRACHELYLRTLFYTGLRVGELLGLQWPDFDFRRGVLTVKRKVKIERKALLVETPKTGKFRDVDLSATLAERWRELQSIRAAEAAVAGAAPSVWCCPSIKEPGRRPLNAAWFNHRVWARALAQAKLRRLRVHDTRHSFAALMLRQGKPMEYVQQQLGHAKIDTTIRFYGHFKPGVNRHYADDFAARIERLEARG